MDRILEPDKPWAFYKTGQIAENLTRDNAYRTKVNDELARLKKTLFATNIIEGKLIPFVDKILANANAVRARVGRPLVKADDVKSQLRAVESSTIQ